MENYTNKKTSVEAAGQNVQSLQNTNQLVSRQESFSQVFDPSIFEVKDKMINLTRIGQHFSKDINTWKKSKKIKNFIQRLDEISGCQNLQTRLGDFEQGTFGTEKVALKFAEYISTDFEIWANDKIHTLLQTGKVELEQKNQTQPKKEFSTLDILKLATSEIEKLSLELTQTKIELDHKQAIIMERVATVPVQDMRTKLNKICRWTKQGDFQYRWRLLYKEFTYTYTKNLKELADNAEMKILDYAEQFGYLENLYNLALKLFEIQREDGEKLLLN